MKYSFKKIVLFTLAAVVLIGILSVPALAAETGDVAGAVEDTWGAAKGEIKQVVNNVIFPVIDLILAVLFFVKVATAYMDCAPVKAL